MLIYHPYYDSKHNLFRILRIIEFINKDIEINKIKILDFLLLFPCLLQNFRFPQDLKKEGREIASKYKTYETLGNKYILFHKLEIIENSSLSMLAAKEIIEADKFRNGFISKGKINLSEELEALVKTRNKENIDLMKLLFKLTEIPLNGSNGLCDRSGLMEYKYALN